MERIVVVGPSGSGKTTIAAALTQKLQYPDVEMDELWWEANWTEAGSEQLRTKLEPIARADRWVIDANYFTVGSRDVVWPRADTIAWLDPPKGSRCSATARLPRIPRMPTSP